MVFGDRVCNAVQRLDSLKKCFLCCVAASRKPLCHVICIHANHGKALCCGLAAVLAADIEFLDRIAHLVDGERSGFCTGDQALGELLCGKSQCRILCGILIEGVQQIAVLIGTVLCSCGNEIVCFFGTDPEVVHECRCSTGAFIDFIAERVAECHSTLCGRLQFFAHQSGLLRDFCHGIGGILVGIPEVVAVHILDHIPKPFQLRSGRTSRRRHLIDRLVELVPGGDHIAKCRQGFLSHVREQIAHCHRCCGDRPFHAFNLLVKTAGITVNGDSDAFICHIISPPPKKRHSHIP